jgi:hypothetical protein
LDEPELHLNPAVCRDLLQFFVDEFAETRNIQAIICSHSAEILASTFERPSCALFHLRDAKTLAAVRYQDQGEIRDALRRLGSSESEALLYRGSVSVEGIHDVEILQAGFSSLFRRYKLKDRGGRREVEKDILELQRTEAKNEDIGYHYFIFDLDDQPTKLTPTMHVRFLQLDRYCLENFLLDAEVMTDLSRNREFSGAPKQTVTAMRDTMKALAMTQMDERIARAVFKDLELEEIKFDMKAIAETGSTAAASNLHSQISHIIAKLTTLIDADFQGEFTTRFSRKKREMEAVWDERWPELCSGKQLFEQLRADGHFKGDLLKLKKAIMAQIMIKETVAYKSLGAMLKTLLSPSV